MFPTKVLLATDGSTEAGQAARVAAALCGSLDSELHLVCVARMPDPYAYPESSMDPRLRDEMRARARRDAHEMLAREEEKVGAIHEVSGAYARAGRPDAQIVEVAEEVGAGLIVLGGRGLGPLGRALLGSVSGSVLRHAHGSVLVVRRDGQAAEGRLGPMVLAVDGSEESGIASEVAAEVSAATGAPLHLIFVLPAEVELYGPHFYSGEVRESLVQEARKRAHKLLDERAGAVRAAGGRVVQTYLASGRADSEIVELAEEIEAGLVVLGSRGLSGIRRALIGSVSESVVRHAHCPVLVVRRDRRDERAPVREAERAARG